MLKNKILAGLMLIWILSSCTSTTENKEIQKEAFKQNIENAKKQIIKNNEVIEKKETEIFKVNYSEKKLTIDDRCIGCMKCVRIAPTNFARNSETMKAVVISQENTNSERVQASIQICPVDSIHLG